MEKKLGIDLKEKLDKSNKNGKSSKNSMKNAKEVSMMREKCLADLKMLTDRIEKVTNDITEKMNTAKELNNGLIGLQSAEMQLRAQIKTLDVILGE